MQKNSFIYTISSQETTTFHPSEWTIDVGGFSSAPTNNFRIEVINCTFDGGLNPTDGYVMLLAKNLAEDGYFCRSLLPSDEAILCTIGCNDDILMSNGGISFNAKNLRMKRQVIFKLLLSTFDIPVDDVNINVGTYESEWLLTLKVTPIED